MVDKLIDICPARREEIGVVGVLVSVERQDGLDSPNRIGVLRVTQVVEQQTAVGVETGPHPTAGGDPRSFQVFLVGLVTAKAFVD